MKDANGTEITVGAKVEHAYGYYSGTGEVVGFTQFSVEVKPAWVQESKQRTSIHCPGLLTVVPVADAKEDAA